MTTEELYELGITHIDRIADEMKQSPDCHENTLDECVSDAKTGLRNTIKEPFYSTVRLGLAEMKGEWTIRKSRHTNSTECEFARRFVAALGKMIKEEFDGSESY